MSMDKDGLSGYEVVYQDSLFEYVRVLKNGRNI